MNVLPFETRFAEAKLQPVPAAPGAGPARHLHRVRDFGVGYGNSSGYASYRRYSDEWIQPRFRCVA